MNRGTWWATVHGVGNKRRDLATELTCIALVEGLEMQKDRKGKGLQAPALTAENTEGAPSLLPACMTHRC